MLLWILIAVVTVAVALFVLRPLAASGLGAARRGEYDLRVYQSQIDDLEAEEARGVISAVEARGARNEIERRMLQAVRDAEPELDSRGKGNLIVGGVVALIVPVAAGLLYMELGRPELPAQPLAERTDIPARATELAARAGGNPGADQTQLGSVDDMVSSLETRLDENPEDFDGWMLLGRSYSVMEQHGEAARAYSEAASLPEAQSDANPHMQMGESLMFASGGIVPEAAVLAFDRALQIDPQHPGARYYKALARGQAGDTQAAYDGWVALARDSAADAPWMPIVRERLQEVATDLGIEVPAEVLAGSPGGMTAPPLPELPPLPGDQASTAPLAAPAGAPGPTAEQMRDAAQMSSEDRSAMIQGMVGRLAERLADEPDDYDGWMRLGNAYGVLGDQQGAADAYRNAARLRPNDEETRMRYAIAVQEASPPGPMTPEAIAAFEELAKVAPNNPDALFMLGMADAQAGRSDAALDKWGKLLVLLPPGSPAAQGVQAQIERLKSGQ